MSFLENAKNAQYAAASAEEREQEFIKSCSYCVKSGINNCRRCENCAIKNLHDELNSSL